MLTVGTAKRLSFELRNLSGTLTNGTTSFTAVKPDGTSTSPTVTNDGTGLYHVDVTLDQAGRWTWVFTSTGSVIVTDAGILDVFSTSLVNIISLADAKRQINASSTDDDDEIESYIAAASAVCEHFTGPIGKRSVTERHKIRGSSVTLDSAEADTPTAVEAVTTGATTVDPADLYVDTGGILRRVDGGTIGNGVYDITYPAGRSDIPQGVGLACRIIFAHLWKTQRGTTSRPSMGGGDTSMALGYAVPNRALELLATYPNRAGGFA